MIKKVSRNEMRKIRHTRIRENLSGTSERPRLCVFRSNANIEAQIIDDVKGVTLVSASSLEKELNLKNGGNDESDPDSTVTIAMATVEKQPQYDAPYLVLDNGEKLWVVQHIVPYRDLKAGERIFGNYSFLEAGESGFAYNIRLNDYTLVPVQKIIGLTPDNMDSIGNMKVQIKDMWPSDDYLNVRFMLNFPSPQKPILNLVVNEMIPWTKDGYAHLELRYNNNGSQGRLVPGMVSFKLDDYSPENSELKGIKVLVNPVDGEEKTYIFSYPLTGEDVPGFNPLDLAELK